MKQKLITAGFIHSKNKKIRSERQYTQNQWLQMLNAGWYCYSFSM